MAWTLAKLAGQVGAEIVGDPAREVHALRTLDEAQPSDLSFVSSPRYLDAARRSRAGALLLGAHRPELTVDQLVVRDPVDALATLLELFFPRPEPVAGVHSTVVVGARCEIDATARVGPYVVLGNGVRIGAGAQLSAHVVVGDGCQIGARSVLHAHVVLYSGVELGEGVEIHSGTVLGADGFGYASGKNGHRKIPQVGGVKIGDAVEIGALSAVDRALLGSTRIGAGTKIDNLVQVGHNVEIGERAILCGQVGIAGSARLGDGVVLGGRAGAGDHVTIGDGVQVASASVVYEDVESGGTLAGVPAIPIQRWRRQQALLKRLEPLWRRLRAVERRLGIGARDSGTEEEQS